MRINLTTLQRRLCIGAAAIVALLLWLQADRVGLDETPWIIGALIILGLLVVAFSPSPHAAATADAKAAPILPAKAFSAAYGVVESEFLPLFEKTVSSLEKNALTTAMADHVRLQSAKLAWLAALMALERAYPGFRKGHRFEGMGLSAGVEFRKHLRSTPGIEGPGSNSNFLRLAAKETAACTIAFDHTFALMVDETPIPCRRSSQRSKRASPSPPTRKATSKIATRSLRLPTGPFSGAP